MPHLRHAGSSEGRSIVFRSGWSSDELRAPRVVALERLIEIEDGDELVSGVGRLAHEQLELHQGEHDVAVKVLRPGVEWRFKRDLGDMYFAARLAERWIGDARRLKLIEVVDTLARTVKMEMDFRLEAAAD